MQLQCNAGILVRALTRICKQKLAFSSSTTCQTRQDNKIRVSANEVKICTVPRATKNVNETPPAALPDRVIYARGLKINGKRG